MNNCISGCVNVSTLSQKSNKPDSVYSYGWKSRKFIWNSQYHILAHCGYCKLDFTCKKTYIENEAEKCPYCDVLNIFVKSDGYRY